jgi:hypothetical protein
MSIRAKAKLEGRRLNGTRLTSPSRLTQMRTHSTVSDSRPVDLLAQPPSVRIQYFKDFTIAHPLLVEAKDRLLEAITESAPNSLVIVLGPTGVGKPTLLAKIRQLLGTKAVDNETERLCTLEFQAARNLGDAGRRILDQNFHKDAPKLAALDPWLRLTLNPLPISLTANVVLTSPLSRRSLKQLNERKPDLVS